MKTLILATLNAAKVEKNLDTELNRDVSHSDDLIKVFSRDKYTIELTFDDFKTWDVLRILVDKFDLLDVVSLN